jgi:hypothetical protein
MGYVIIIWIYLIWEKFCIYCWFSYFRSRTVFFQLVKITN